MPPDRPGPSAWTRVPERAALRGLAVVLVALPLVVLLGAVAGGAQGALGAGLGTGLAALCQVLTWGAARLGRSESAHVFALLLVSAYATKAGVVLVAVLVLGDRLPQARPALAMTAGLTALLAATVEALVVTRTRAPYVEPVTPQR